MFRVLLVLFFDLSLTSSCSNFCKFIWDNTTGNQTRFGLGRSDGTVGPLGLTGFITLDGQVLQTTPPSVNLTTKIAFHEYLAVNDALILHFKIENGTGRNSLDLLGAYSNRKTNTTSIADPFVNNEINIQISDRSASQLNYYSLYPSIKSPLYQYDYGDQGSWNKMYNRARATLSRTDTIKTSLEDDNPRPHIINYLSACSNSTPMVCGVEKTDSPKLGSDFNLTCVGSGAPYLEMEWNTTNNVAMTTHPATYDSSNSDHMIKSVLTLNHFSLNHIGTYTCILRNINFNIKVAHDFELTYTQPINITFLSKLTFSSITTPVTLHWNVTGWPLSDLTLTCNTPEANCNSSLSTSLPSGNYSATFTTNNDIVICTFSNLSGTVSMTTVYKVGMNCSAGEFGRGFQCTNCPGGQTSLPASESCFYGNTSCTAGTYYDVTKSKCVVCPGDYTSDAGAVKVQECYQVNKTCDPGCYSRNETCLFCPLGTTSYGKWAKLEDCFQPTKNCQPNYFNSGDNFTDCSLCPNGMISAIGAAKLEDCLSESNSCPMNFYGVNESCSLCPPGTLSESGAVKVEECATAQSTCNRGSWGTDMCELCPWGETSDRMKAVKPQDCYSYPKNKTCPSGQYISTACATCHVTCTDCPANHSSRSGAAKLEDCQEMASNCTEGSYGYGNNCTLCPDNQTSPPKSKSRDQCVSTKISPQVVFVIAVTCVMILLGLIMVGTFVRFKLKQRRQSDGIRAMFNTSRNEALIVKNEFAD